MTPERMRVKIAEACGWTGIESYYPSYDGPPKMDWRGIGNTNEHRKHLIFEPLPNYPGDLNACHEMANYLRNANRGQYLQYGKMLENLVAIYNSLPEREAYHGILVCDAPPEMRCEAFLRTLGLWEEGVQT